MVDYTLKFSNAFNRKSEADYEYDELKIKGDCKITNYDPNTSDGKKKGLITIDFSKNYTTIKSGLGDKLSTNHSVADFSNKKYSILHEIARLDNNNEVDVISMDDIKNIDSSKKADWGLKDLIVDIEKGIATLIWNIGDVLRIDFETKTELLNKTVEDSKSVKTDNKNNRNIASAATTQVAKSVELNNQNKILINNGEEKGDSTAFLIALGEQESGGEKNPYFCKNKFGYVGRYQMGEQAMAEMGIYKKKADPNTKSVNYNNDWTGFFVKNKYGIENLWDYRTSPEKQDLLQADYKKKEWITITKMGLNKYVGKIINGTTITESGMLAGSHLVGVGGLKKYLISNGTNDVKDGTGTRISYYIKKFEGYNVTEFTEL